jgi:hypothetical protein
VDAALLLRVGVERLEHGTDLGGAGLVSGALGEGEGGAEVDAGEEGLAGAGEDLGERDAGGEFGGGGVGGGGFVGEGFEVAEGGGGVAGLGLLEGGVDGGREAGGLGGGGGTGGDVAEDGGDILGSWMVGPERGEECGKGTLSGVFRLGLGEPKLDLSEDAAYLCRVGVAAAMGLFSNPQSALDGQFGFHDSALISEDHPEVGEGVAETGVLDSKSFLLDGERLSEHGLRFAEFPLLL